jgi:hypothetical protein
MQTYKGSKMRFWTLVKAIAFGILLAELIKIFAGLVLAGFMTFIMM